MYVLLRAWELFAVIAFGAAVQKLGDVDWETREAAEEKLHGEGLLAYPAIAAGVSSSSPEIAVRCRRLVVPRDREFANLAAAAVLLNIIEPDYEKLHLSPGTRRRLADVAEAFGCSARATSLFDVAKDMDPFFCAWWGVPESIGVKTAVHRCRKELRREPWYSESWEEEP